MTAAAAAPALGRRERKKQATRAALSEAAVRLALAHGVEHVTAERIADEADVSLRTFFNYFAGKEEAIVEADVLRSHAFVADFLARPPEESVLEALHRAFAARLRSAALDERFEAMRLVRATPSLRAHQFVAHSAAEQALARAVAERAGLDAPGQGGAEPGSALYPALTAAVVMAAVRTAFQRWLAPTAPTAEDGTAEDGTGEDGTGDVGDLDGGAPARTPDALVALLDEAFEPLVRGLDRPSAPAATP